MAETYATEIEFVQPHTVGALDPKWADSWITSVDLSTFVIHIDRALEGLKPTFETIELYSQTEFEFGRRHLQAIYLENVKSIQTIERAGYIYSGSPHWKVMSTFWGVNPPLTSAGILWTRKDHLADKVGQEVPRQYSQISEVEAIYKESLGDELLFWVFSSEESYDDALMDRLLDVEEELLDMYPEVPMTFRYVPSILCHNHREVTGTKAKLLYAR